MCYFIWAGAAGYFIHERNYPKAPSKPEAPRKLGLELEKRFLVG